ncbi:MAG TPA: ABC transporter substrate-binding protein [Acetobacteraceae bacterium]|nr:ABC transporter substrate-binding protein [Acetobacteraceae bacterium]
MKQPSGVMVDRRELLRMLGIGGAAFAATALDGPPVFAQSHKGTIVLAIDFADTVTFDPAHQSNYVAPLIVAACYECLVTMTPDDYVNVKPCLATSWQRTPDGKGWRFTLRDGVKFPSGNVMTADDWVYSLNREQRVGDQPSQYLSNVASFDKVDDKTIDVVLKAPEEPILTILAAPSFVACEKKVLEEHGADASTDAKAKDKARTWLDQNSVGTGPYKLVRWEQNSQIQLVANPHYWRGKPPFDRVVFRHMPDSAVQLLSLQRGDVDAAFNLIPEQIATLKDNKDIWINRLFSTDFVYLALTSEPAFNKALAVKQARQAIGYAIDYDGIKNSLMAGNAVKPASFLPIGTNGSTEEIAREIGFHEDLDKAKKLLAEAGLPNGFEFDLQYGTSSITGTTFQVLAQKLQSDLARVGIVAKLVPLDTVTFRTQYTTYHATSALTFWNPPAIESELWAAATVERVARRVHWVPPDDVVKLVHRAAAETDKQKQIEMWKEYQRIMVDQANLIMLFQPIYQIGIRRTVKTLPLTAAGWQVDMYGVTPA